MVADRAVQKEALVVQQDWWELEWQAVVPQGEGRELARRQLEVMHGILGFLSDSAHSQDYLAWMICDIVKGEVILWTQAVGGVSGEVIPGPEGSGNWRQSQRRCQRR